MNTPETSNPDKASQPGAHPPPIEQKPLSRWLFIGLGVAAVLLAIVIYAGIHQRAEAENNLGHATERAAVPTVSVVQPKSNAAAQEIVLPGNTQAFSDTPIYARTNGYLKRWYFDIGARVQRGQLLAEIETPEVDQQLEQTRADLKTAQANEQIAAITAARWQNLLKTNAVSKQETDQAVSDLSARRATVDSMAANVHRLEQVQSFE
jgi:multidrug efflux pump subunit AcrA (membrane-fusion protein)